MGSSKSSKHLSRGRFFDDATSRSSTSFRRVPLLRLATRVLLRLAPALSACIRLLVICAKLTAPCEGVASRGFLSCSKLVPMPSDGINEARPKGSTCAIQSPDSLRVEPVHYTLFHATVGGFTAALLQQRCCMSVDFCSDSDRPLHRSVHCEPCVGAREIAN